MIKIENKYLYPSAMTFFGFMSAVLFLNGGHWAFGVCGLLADWADGLIAREIDAESEFGSDFDWLCDVLIVAIGIGQFTSQLFLIVIVPVQLAARWSGVKFSGRSLILGALLLKVFVTRF